MRTVFEVIKESGEKIIYMCDNKEFNRLIGLGLLNSKLEDGTKVEIKCLSKDVFDNLEGAEEYDLSDIKLTK